MKGREVRRDTDDGVPGLLQVAVKGAHEVSIMFFEA